MRPLSSARRPHRPSRTRQPPERWSPGPPLCPPPFPGGPEDAALCPGPEGPSPSLPGLLGVAGAKGNPRKFLLSAPGLLAGGEAHRVPSEGCAPETREARLGGGQGRRQSRPPPGPREPNQPNSSPQALRRLECLPEPPAPPGGGPAAGAGSAGEPQPGEERRPCPAPPSSHRAKERRELRAGAAAEGGGVSSKRTCPGGREGQGARGGAFFPGFEPPFPAAAPLPLPSEGLPPPAADWAPRTSRGPGCLRGLAFVLPEIAQGAFDGPDGGRLRAPSPSLLSPTPPPQARHSRQRPPPHLGPSSLPLAAGGRKWGAGREELPARDPSQDALLPLRHVARWTHPQGLLPGPAAASSALRGPFSGGGERLGAARLPGKEPRGRAGEIWGPWCRGGASSASGSCKRDPETCEGSNVAAP
ncbi:basic proline-rich protein-like [Heteronotia binoei]|uniref:basic proline-rich protein-like n=1 Tax=Heteronotia binoei TaxID=13085 RepID=UPI00292F2DA5|nr:basic proline-rich protein-like [Heteronotia binoei]